MISIFFPLMMKYKRTQKKIVIIIITTKAHANK